MRYIKPLIFGLGIVVFLPLSTFASGLLRVSVDSNGNEGNGITNPYSVTPDGRYVLFSSDATNLAPNDTNGVTDIFVSDTINNTTTVVSVDDVGNYADAASQPIGITPDGRYIVFGSTATNLVPNDTNGFDDVFVRDTVNNTTSRVSIDTVGNEGNDGSYPISITPDGRYILFQSAASNLDANDTVMGNFDAFIRDTVNNTTTRASIDIAGSEGNDHIFSISLTPDGRYILFQSAATNLVANDTNGQYDVFVRDIINNITTRVSVDSSGNEGNDGSYPISITPDGRYILFQSTASNLVANDTNGVADAFVRDTVNNTTILVNIDNNGNAGNNTSYSISISPDGRYVLFDSTSDNLVANDTNGSQDTFVRDTVNNITTLVSDDTFGNIGDGYSHAIGISDDGGYVLFNSLSSNLVANDSNFASDVFVRDMINNTMLLVSADSFGNVGNNNSEATAITPDGVHLIFQSYSDNLVANDTNGQQDAFIYTIGQGKYSPTILSPILGITTGNNSILVNGTGTIGNQIELIGSGISYVTNIDGNGDRYVQLPPYGEGVYIITATEKTPGGIVFGDTGYTAFIIDTMPSTVTTQLVSVDDNWNQGNGYSYFQKNSITPDGRYVLFTSYADNLVANDANGYGDVFVRDTVNNTTKLISVNNGGNGADNGSQAQSITPDGRYVLFMSFASDLVANDTNGQQDAFVRDTVNNTTILITQHTNGTLSNNYSQAKSITPNGRYVLFDSYADNLVASDTNVRVDTFVRDTVNNTTILVSSDSAGDEGNDNSQAIHITPNGRYVTFGSDSTNLIANDTNNAADIFLKDLSNNSVVRQSVDSAGNQSDGNSYGYTTTPNGRYVVFRSAATNLVPNDTNGFDDVFVRDTVNNITTLISVDNNGNVGNDYSGPRDITPDGRYVVFISNATNLTPNNDVNGNEDIFVRDTVNNTTILVSSDTQGNAGNQGSYDPTISDDGRYVAFQSDSDNIGMYDVNWMGDIFMRDTVNNTTIIVSANDMGNASNGYSYEPQISSNGKYVFYYSDSIDLVPNDVNNEADIFMSELQIQLLGQAPTIVTPLSGSNTIWNTPLVYGTGTSGMQLELVGSGVSYLTNIDHNGDWYVQLPTLVDGTYELSAKQKNTGDSIWSALGYSTFTIDSTTSGQLTKLVSVDSMWTLGNNISSSRAITPNGRYVLFNSTADNLVADDTNGQRDIFVRDTVNNTTRIVNVDSNGNQVYGDNYERGISADGRYVIFESNENNLVAGDTNGQRDAFVRDMVNNTTAMVNVDNMGNRGNGNASPMSITPDGRYIVFISDANNLGGNDTNGQRDVFVRDIVNNTTTIVSVDDSFNVGAGQANDIGITADGRYVFFNSSSNNLVAGDTNGQNDIFVRDMINNTTSIVSVDSNGTIANNSSYIAPYNPSIYSFTPDGRYVMFNSYADNLVANDTNGQADMFVRDMVNNTTTMISVDNNGNQSNGEAYPLTMSPNGRYVMFKGYGDNLVPNDTNGQGDIFVRDMINNTTSIVNVDSNGNQGNGYPAPAGVTDDGIVFFGDSSTNLVPNDTNGQQDVFMRDLVNNTTTLLSSVGSGDVGDGSSSVIGFTPNGQYILIDSYATDLVSNDTNGQGDVFIRENELFIPPVVSLITPTIITPANGSTTGINNPVVYGTGTSGNQLELLGSGVSYLTNIDSNGDWYVQLPTLVDGTYTLEAKQKAVGDIVWSDTGFSTFTIDTYVAPSIAGIPTIIIPANGSTTGTKNPVVYGTGTSGNQLELLGSGVSYLTNIDSNGDWYVQLPILVDGTYTLEAKQKAVGDIIWSSIRYSIFTVSTPVVETPKPGFGGGGSSSSPTVIIPINNPIPPIVPIKEPVKPESNTPSYTIITNVSTPAQAMKSALISTQNAYAGEVVSIQTQINPALSSEKKCYTPEEIANITLGKNTTTKDLLIYQALLKSYGLTIFSDTDKYMPENGLKRYEAAKMFTNFAKHILCREAKDVYVEGYYNDISNVDITLVPYIKEAYAYGILKGSNNKFRPLDIISRKEFVVALMRMFINKYLDEKGKGNNWDEEYQKAFVSYELDSVVAISDNIDRYDMSKIMYKLYYNTTYQWTEKGYVLPYVSE